MAELLTIFILLIAGLIFSELFTRLHLPYVTALIVGGILIGPYGMDLVTVDGTINLLSSIGVVFLMFIAGSEIKSEAFSALGRRIGVIAFFVAALPFAVGIAIGIGLGYSMLTAAILGIVFVSSSIAVVIPSLEARDLVETKIGETIISAAVLADVTSLLLLAVVLQTATRKTGVPLPLYIILIIGLVVALRYVIPKLEEAYHAQKKGRDLFESELRFIFAALLATVVLFELIGVHAIVGGFLVGIVLGDTIRGSVEEKIKTLGYGLFIPIFFLVLGMRIDLAVFVNNSAIFLTSVIVIGLYGAKLLGGWLGGRIARFSNNESLLIGVAATPQLSTTLAAAFAALEFGLLDNELIAALVVLSTITTLLSPILLNYIESRDRFT